MVHLPVLPIGPIQKSTCRDGDRNGVWLSKPASRKTPLFFQVEVFFCTGHSGTDLSYILPSRPIASKVGFVATGFVAQIGRRIFFPLPHRDLGYGLSDRYAKSRIAVEDGNADLDFCDLPFQAPRHQRLAEWFHTMHLRFDATSAVVSTPLSPQGTQVSLRFDGFVAGNCSIARRLPGLCILAWRDPRAGISGRNCLMAFARVIRPVCSDTSYVLIRRDLVQEFG